MCNTILTVIATSVINNMVYSPNKRDTKCIYKPTTERTQK